MPDCPYCHGTGEDDTGDDCARCEGTGRQGYGAGWQGNEAWMAGYADARAGRGRDYATWRHDPRLDRAYSYGYEAGSRPA